MQSAVDGLLDWKTSPATWLRRAGDEVSSYPLTACRGSGLNFSYAKLKQGQVLPDADTDFTAPGGDWKEVAAAVRGLTGCVGFLF